MATVTKSIFSETDVQRMLHQILKQLRKVQATKLKHLLPSMHFSVGRSERKGEKQTKQPWFSFIILIKQQLALDVLCGEKAGVLTEGSVQIYRLKPDF